MYNGRRFLFMSEYKCNKCGDIFDSCDGLRRHFGRIHKVSSYQFYVDVNLNGVWPVCKCGCGEKVMWSRQLKGFRDFVAGHQSRIHNNWGHNQKAIDKSSETRRRQFENGERQVWNDGLTKEVDERVKNNGIKSSIGINSNPLELKRRAENMSKNRLNGIIPTLSGSKHSQWIDGRSNISMLVYNDRRLYKEWKYPILCRDGFKCVECNKQKVKLHIHHNKEYMNEIIKKHLIEVTDDMLKDFQIKRMVADSVVDYHIKHKVSGITLCDKCHNKLHPSLNFS